VNSSGRLAKDGVTGPAVAVLVDVEELSDVTLEISNMLLRGLYPARRLFSVGPLTCDNKLEVVWGVLTCSFTALTDPFRETEGDASRAFTSSVLCPARRLRDEVRSWWL
jgi:hypothetical protein